MTIDAIFVDADGVIQRPGADRRALFSVIAGGEHHVDALMSEIFTAEGPCLTGAEDFAAQLSLVLSRWRSQITLRNALVAWTHLQVDLGIIGAIRSLRQAGLMCCLATNQESYRARYMSNVLGYASVFDREFYSCDVGHVKPDPAYFEAILEMARLHPSHVLFFDDHQPNVASAQDVGINGVHFAANTGADVFIRTLGDFGIHVPNNEWSRRARRSVRP